jgi:hypothetical protein
MPRPKKDQKANAPAPAAVPVAPQALLPQTAQAPALPPVLPDNNVATLVINRADYARLRDSVSLIFTHSGARTRASRSLWPRTNPGVLYLCRIISHAKHFQKPVHARPFLYWPTPASCRVSPTPAHVLLTLFHPLYGSPELARTLSSKMAWHMSWRMATVILIGTLLACISCISRLVCSAL